MHGIKSTHYPVLPPSPKGSGSHTYQSKRAFRIRLAVGLNCSKAVSISFASELLTSSHLGRLS